MSASAGVLVMVASQELAYAGWINRPLVVTNKIGIIAIAKNATSLFIFIINMIKIKLIN